MGAKKKEKEKKVSVQGGHRGELPNLSGDGAIEGIDIQQPKIVFFDRLSNEHIRFGNTNKLDRAVSWPISVAMVPAIPLLDRDLIHKVNGGERHCPFFE